MLRSLGVVWLLVLALAVDAQAAGDGTGGRGGPPKQHGQQLDVELVADGLVAPLNLTFAPDRSGRRLSSTKPDWC
jgi:hypothetical protein